MLREMTMPHQETAMPQMRKYATRAEQQVAYRQRCEQARKAEMAGKGLPSLPAIATLPGWPRWNASLKAAHELLTCTLDEMQDYFSDRSEAWQESERGEEHQERIASLETVIDSLGELSR
jgi:hypothetical protein